MKSLVVCLLCVMALLGCVMFHNSPESSSVACNGNGILGVRGRVQDRHDASRGLLRNKPLRRGLGRLLGGC